MKKRSIKPKSRAKLPPFPLFISPIRENRKSRSSEYEDFDDFAHQTLTRVAGSLGRETKNKK